LTRSYFRHARFTYKAYALLNEIQLDSLYSILSGINKQPLGYDTQQSYLGFFFSLRHNNSFFIELEPVVSPPKTSLETKKEIQALYNFLDFAIKWNKTYKL
jgi:hypothetical protein